MTDTIPTDIDTTEDAVAQPIGELEHLDPQTLIIGDNVRTDAGLDKDFLASIKLHGVLMPITAVRDSDGNALVRDGQRRTLAARQAGHPTIPAYVLPSAATTFRDYEVERIAQQIVLNDQKADLTEAQRARGIQAMLDAGVSVTKVAKLLSTKKTVVQSAEAAGKSRAAMDALSEGQLTLEQAAIVAEFADDDDAVDQLLTAPPARFDHLVSRLRKDRESEKAFAEASAHYQELGVSILTDYPDWRDLGCVGLRYLTTPDGGEVTEDMVTPGPLWAAWLSEGPAFFDKETGERVDEDDLDYDTKWNRDDEAEDGLRHYDSVVEKTIVEPEWFCLDYAAAGLALAPALRGLSERGSGSAGGSVSAEVVDAEAQADADRRARRMVIALNKLGDAATPVRRQWIRTTLLARKTPVKGAPVFVTKALVNDPHLITDFRLSEIAAELLGLSTGEKSYGGRDAVSTHLDGLGVNGDGRAQVVALALVLAGLESRCPKDAWRSGGANTAYRTGLSNADYLAFLEANGYVLADIEQVIVGGKKADDLYDEIANPGKEDPTDEDD